MKMISAMSKENSQEFGFEYVHDIPSTFEAEGRWAKTLAFAAKQGCVFGQAFNPSQEFIGLYRPADAEIEPIVLAEDPSLTPETAAAKGFIWAYDTFHYGVTDFDDSLETIHLVLDEGYKLGQSASIMLQDVQKGVYAPLKQD